MDEKYIKILTEQLHLGRYKSYSKFLIGSEISVLPTQSNKYGTFETFHWFKIKRFGFSAKTVATKENRKKSININL